MFPLAKILNKSINKNQIATILKTTPEALTAFEQEYNKLLATEPMSDNLFDINAKQAAGEHEGVQVTDNPAVHDIIERIVDELINITPVWEWDGTSITEQNAIRKTINNPVTNEEIKVLPEELRPQCTGTLAQVDITEPAYMALLDEYTRYQKEQNPKTKMNLYHHFRQGLDILDLDAITYEIIGTNPNSMGHWLPQITKAAKQEDFFQIPKTTIIKVPLPMLQLTRLEYTTLTRTTLDIVNKFCQKIFRLDETKDYFIKTGTYSSKFDFRNARVHDAKEVRELGEYLLFIHFQACMMASPLNNKSIYGVSTTNEWVVREFIKDKEDNPCIYKGLPLHTEYRVFVDFDTKEILGVNPYWDPDVMKQRFGHEPDADSPHNLHDYMIYAAHEETLMKRYHDNKNLVVDHVKTLLQDTEGLSGQWSIDIMQNKDDFWLIDMALAVNSALNHCVPADKLKPITEDWLPKLG